MKRKGVSDNKKLSFIIIQHNWYLIVTTSVRIIIYS